MSLTPDQERWAEAARIEKMYGERAPPYVTVLIGRLTKAGDEAEVVRFQKIAVQLEQLRRAPHP